MQTHTGALLDETSTIESLYAAFPRRRTASGIEFIDVADEFINGCASPTRAC